MDFLIEEELAKFQNKFKNLDKIKKGDKLYYHNDVIEIIEDGYLQSLTRMIYFQDRHTFYEQFKNDIKRLNKILVSLINNNNLLLIALNYNNLIFNKIKKLQKLLIKTINILIQTYHDDEEYIKKLVKLIESINRFYQ